MQNAQIWKSIEALCDEAESVIKNGEPVITVIQSIKPPALAYQGTSQANTSNSLSSKPAPPKANIVDKPALRENSANSPLSTATMAEIAAAIDRVGQSAQKPLIIDHPPQMMSDKLRKDLMVEVSLAVRSVLENELPKMVRHAISESLCELINSPANPAADKLEIVEAKPLPKNKKKKITRKDKLVSMSATYLEGMSKRELEKLGREYGIELDRRYKKSTLVEQMKNMIEQSELGG